jgi:hypothetical protein
MDMDPVAVWMTEAPITSEISDIHLGLLRELEREIHGFAPRIKVRELEVWVDGVVWVYRRIR